MATCLITGGAGNLGCQLSRALADYFQRIVLYDVVDSPCGNIATTAIVELGDLSDEIELDKLFVRYRPDVVIHLASLLSGSCERDRDRAWKVNMDGTFLLMETAVRRNVATLLFASSVAAFGGELPDVLSDNTPQWPDGLYGVTKMAGERLGVYYHRRHGLDFRCLRLPTTISRSAPVGAVSALASHAFLDAAQTGQFVFRSRPETKLALIYVQDVLQAFVHLLKTPAERLTQRVYNVHSMTVTLRELADAIRNRLPRAELVFEPDAEVTTLLESWPERLDDSAARRDWGWSAEFDLDRTADHFLAEIHHHLRRHE